MGSQGSCGGDSGGPLVCKTDRNKMQLYGINSRAFDTEEYPIPPTKCGPYGIFTSVPHWGLGRKFYGCRRFQQNGGWEYDSYGNRNLSISSAQQNQPFGKPKPYGIPQLPVNYN